MDIKSILEKLEYSKELSFGLNHSSNLHSYYCMSIDNAIKTIKQLQEQNEEYKRIIEKLQILSNVFYKTDDFLWEEFENVKDTSRELWAIEKHSTKQHADLCKSIDVIIKNFRELKKQNEKLKLENDWYRDARQNLNRHGKATFNFYYMLEKVQKFTDTTALIAYHNKPNIVLMSEEKYKNLIKEPKAFVSVAENDDE